MAWWRGRLRARDVECKTAVHPFTYMGYVGWTANPYNGCGHRCVYCYASSFEWFPDFFDRVSVKRNFPTVLSRQLADQRVPGPIFLSSATDCYQPLEASFLLTRRSVEVLQRREIPYYIFTKSTLILRDLNLHARYRDRCVIVWSLTTLDERVKRVIEPFSPPAGAVLKVVQRFSEKGVKVGVNIDPVIPGLTDEGLEKVVAAVERAGGEFVSTGVLRLRPEIWRRMRRLFIKKKWKNPLKEITSLYLLQNPPRREDSYIDAPENYSEEVEKRVEEKAEELGLLYGIPLPPPKDSERTGAEQIPLIL